MPAVMPLARANDLVVQETEDKCLIYDLVSHKTSCLNSMSTRIWKQCDGKQKIKDVAKNLSKQLNARLDEDFIWLAITDLQKNDLLENKTVASSALENFSRRAVVLKYSLPSWFYEQVFR